MTALPSLRGGTPSIAEVAGQRVVLNYGDVAAEYAALRTGALLVDRSDRGRFCIQGAKAAELLSGLVTNDVQSLAPGLGQYAAALTPKGKIIADVRIFARADDLMVDCAPRARAGWTETMRKYVNPRQAQTRDESEMSGDIGLFGPGARQFAAQATGLSIDTLGTLPIYGHITATLDGVPVLVTRVPDLEIEGYELIVPSDSFPGIWNKLTASGATPAGVQAWDIGRIEAGRPEWGIDMDENTLPQEANLEELHAISYTKGCYVGQETVARVHFRGHVNRLLRGLLCGDGNPPAPKSLLFDDKGKQVGDVRSSALSPRLGAIALAMVRREVAPGTTVAVRWDGGETAGDVARLPFSL